MSAIQDYSGGANAQTGMNQQIKQRNLQKTQQIIREMYGNPNESLYIIPSFDTPNLTDTRSPTLVPTRIFQKDPKKSIGTPDRFAYLPRLIASNQAKLTAPNKNYPEPDVYTGKVSKIPIEFLKKNRIKQIKIKTPTESFFESI